MEGAINKRKQLILNYLNSEEKDWNDYQWQLKNSFSKAIDISNLLNLNKDEALNIEVVSKKFRFLISPYFLSLIDPQNINCPVRKQCIPSLEPVILPREVEQVWLDQSIVDSNFLKSLLTPCPANLMIVKGYAIQR